MKKNTASQVISFQMISATDGSPVTTGTPVVWVCGDGGTSASQAGSTAVHEGTGTGCWSYVPTQGETDYNHISFTMLLSGAIAQTVNVYPTFPQTGDSFGLIGTTGSGLTSLATQASVNTIDDFVDGLETSVASLATASALATVDSEVGTILGRVIGTIAAGTHTAQTGDAYARLGAPALASVSADILAIDNLVDDLETRITEARLSELDAGTAGKMANQVDIIQTDTTTDIPATITTMQGNVTSVLADTNELQTDWTNGGRLDLILDAASAPSAATVADAVWDELIAGHAGVGSTGAALAAAGGSGDPWATALPGAYGAGTAGKLIGDNVNASLAAILLDTGTTLDGKIDAIKAKTDNLPTDPADQSAVEAAIPTADAIAIAILKKDFTGITGEAARSLLNAVRFLRNKWSVVGGVLTVTKEDDTTSAWTATVTGDAAADPITGSTPL